MDTLLALGAVVAGVVLLVVSADRFVTGAAETSRTLGLPPLLIGMLVIGFGSSMPEMVISGFSAAGGNPGLALGNAMGSNIANIALILGATALISPITVRSRVIKLELPLLVLISLLFAGLILHDGALSRGDGYLLLAAFAAALGWSLYLGIRSGKDSFGDMVEQEITATPLARSLTMTVVGLVVLVASSRLLVWGGVEIAKMFGVNDLIIGLTIVAVGTSLPELASSIAAVRKNEHELALGNVIGSNMFNTSIVIGISALISPAELDPGSIIRDLPVMISLTAVLFLTCYGGLNPASGRLARGQITRWEGALLLLIYAGYNAWLIWVVFSSR